jgi:rRNA processing protein Gar1
LRSLGKILEITSTGLLITRPESTPRIGSKVIDNRKRNIGFVKNIIGPVSAPYVVISVNKQDRKSAHKLIGIEVYTK